MSIFQQLEVLESSSLIRLIATRPELEYFFRHALIQDAAYAALLKAEQKRLHQQVGEALEAMYPERREELAGLLAYHFAAAGERVKAVAYSRQAAAQAIARYAYEEAAQHLRTALALSEAGEVDETQLSVLEELADVYGLLREGLRAIPLYQQALEGLPRRTDAGLATELRLHRKIIQTISDTRWRVNLEQQDQAGLIGVVSRANLEAALQRLVAQAPQAETVHLLKALSNDAWRNRLPPDWEAAELHARVALDVAERLQDASEISSALGALANVRLARGLLRDQMLVAQRRLEVSAPAGSGELAERVDSLRGGGMALMYVGEYEAALTHLREAERLAAHIHAVGQQFNVLSIQSQCCLRLDRWDEVLTLEAAWRELVQRYSRERTGVT
ncbi:MAG: hypothetical protein HYR71_09325 [Chloroflexi bacterium]|nr:hypothetical protein [Chloroflexota bacterium]